MYNLGWQLFPNQGSHYDPRITGLLMAFAAVIVTGAWGPKSLTNYRKGIHRPAARARTGS
jgi:hypothetical protein